MNSWGLEGERLGSTATSIHKIRMGTVTASNTLRRMQVGCFDPGTDHNFSKA